MIGLNLILLVLGAVSTVAGTALIDRPAALIVAGVEAITFSLFVDDGR